MKVRNDFVSNSSSCSFIIDAKNARKACEVVYSKLYGLEVPYDINTDITVRLYAKNKNVDKLFADLHESGFVGSSDKPYHYADEDPEAFSFDSIDLEVQSFIELAKKLSDDKELVSLIEQIMFESDDYGSGPMNLRDFYDFFAINKCKPNAENSEHEFMCEDELDFRSVLKGTSRK